MAKTYSGKQVVKILCRKFGFSLVSQKGSHVKLRRKYKNKTITTIIPMHKELSLGTLSGVLDLAEIEIHDFRNK